MIIDIFQNKTIGTRRFDIYYNKNRTYEGNVPATSSLSACQLLWPDGSIALSTQSSVSHIAQKIFARVFMFLPLGLALIVALLFPPDESPSAFIITGVSAFVGLSIYLIFIDSLLKYKRKRCRVFGFNCGAVEFYQQSGGLFLMNYVIATDDKLYKLYSVAKGSVGYMPIYLNDAQIGQINVDMNSYRKKDYTVYLLDEHAALGDKLSLFVLYYHSINYARRGELKFGKQYYWTFSRANKLYNPDWLKDNFDGNV